MVSQLVKLFKKTLTKNIIQSTVRPQCEAQVKGFTSPIFRKFNTYDEAVNFVISKGGKLDHDIDKESSSNDTSKGDVKKQITQKLTGSAKTNKANKRMNDDANDTNPNKKVKKDNAEIPVKRLIKYGEHSFSEDDDGYVHVFTDGSCEGNGTNKAVAGLGVYFGEGHALYVQTVLSSLHKNNLIFMIGT